MSPFIRIYVAGPLFTQGEWIWNQMLAERLRDLGVDVLLPQERSIPMMNGAEPFSADVLFDANVSSIESCDVVLAVVDQPDPDSGTSWECGYAYKLGKPILGLRTDFRNAGDDGALPVNLMLARSFAAFIEVPVDKRTNMDWLVERVVTDLQIIMSNRR